MSPLRRRTGCAALGRLRLLRRGGPEPGSRRPRPSSIGLGVAVTPSAMSTVAAEILVRRREPRSPSGAAPRRGGRRSELGLGELGVGRRVSPADPARRWRRPGSQFGRHADASAVRMRRPRGSASGGCCAGSSRNACGCGPRRSARPGLSASRGARCASGTSGSTCAAAGARGCCACSYSSGSYVACTPHRRGWQRSGRLHGP